MILPKIHKFNSLINTKPDMQVVKEYLKVDAINLAKNIGVHDKNTINKLNQLFEEQNFKDITAQYKIFNANRKILSINKKISNITNLINTHSNKQELIDYEPIQDELNQYNSLIKNLLKITNEFHKKISKTYTQSSADLGMSPEEYFTTFPTYFILMKTFPEEKNAKKYRFQELKLQKQCYDLEQKINQKQIINPKLEIITNITPEIFLQDEVSEHIFEYRMSEIQERWHHQDNLNKEYLKT